MQIQLLEKPTTAQTLRPYQEDAIAAIQVALEKGEKPLISLFTGAGKTTVMAELLVRMIDPACQRAMVLAHTEELIMQPYERIGNQMGECANQYYGPSFAPGLGIVLADRDEQKARIVVASRQSLHPKRLEKVLTHGVFDLLIIDEAHHVAPGNTYHTIIKTLLEANPNLRIVGLTATPQREDGKALGVVFTNIAFSKSLLNGIQMGYLVPPTRIIVKTGINLSQVHKQTGDYDKKELLGVLEAGNWLDLAVGAYQKYIAGQQRPAIAFFPNKAMSKAFAEKLIVAGVAAGYVDDSTPKHIRRGILKAFREGGITIISNVAVFTEGFDAPLVSAILWARPTQSSTVLTQALGRGLRLHPNKSDCLFVDLTVDDTRALEVGTLLGKMLTCAECKAELYKGLKHCPRCGAEIAKQINTSTKQGGAFFISPTNPDAGDAEGDDLVDEIGQLFGGLTASWHQEGEFYTTPVGGIGGLVIAPPTYFADERVARLRERISNGQEMLTKNTVPGDKRPKLVEQISRLQRELYRTDNYQLYFVKFVGKYEEHLDRAEYLRVNSDVISLMKEADVEALIRAGDSGAKLTRKDEVWRYDTMTRGQLGLLHQLGIRIDDEERYTMTKGTAAELINHYRSLYAVQGWIARDTLPEKKES